MTTIRDLVSVTLDDENADFWITRSGDQRMVGTPSKTFAKGMLGVTVLDQTKLVPDYLYYLCTFLHMGDKYRPHLKGSTNLVHIGPEAVYRVLVEYFTQQAQKS